MLRVVHHHEVAGDGFRSPVTHEEETAILEAEKHTRRLQWKVGAYTDWWATHRERGQPQLSLRARAAFEI